MYLAIIECDMQLIYAIFKTFVRLQEHLSLLRHEKLSQLLYVRGLPRGLRDKRHCFKMWRQFVTKVPTADRS